MEAPKPGELIKRVVAWHNRHPLARRVDEQQVHSLGEVRLPFAAKPAQPAPLAATATAAAAVPTPAQAPHTEPGSLASATEAEAPAAAEDLAPEPATIAELSEPAQAPAADAAPPDAEAEAEPAPTSTAPAPEPQAEADEQTSAAPADTPAAEDDGAGADLGGLDGLDAALADAEAHALANPPAPEVPLDPAAAGLDAALEHWQEEGVAPTPAEPGAEPASADAGLDGLGGGLGLGSGLDAAAASAAQSPEPPPAGTAALRARGKLLALFSEKFMFPVSPARVARWARRHGQLRPIAPEDWPVRTVDTDPKHTEQARIRGQLDTLTVHVLTVGIGVGDRRLRLLIGADGAVLGPRSYSPPRLAAAGLMAMSLLVGGRLLWHPKPAPAAPEVVEMASAASAPASAAEAAEAASASEDGASAPAHSAEAAHAAASAAEPAAAETSAAGHAAAPAGGPGAASAALAQAEPAAASAVVVNLPQRFAPPGLVRTQRASEPLARIRPLLSDEEKLAARAAVAVARGEPPPPPPITYALVTTPTPQRSRSEDGLQLMRSASAQLLPPLPEHLEVLPAGRQWRAAWWPFTSLADAERARVLLGSRGLKAEVVEF